MQFTLVFNRRRISNQDSAIKKPRTLNKYSNHIRYLHYFRACSLLLLLLLLLLLVPESLPQHNQNDRYSNRRAGGSDLYARKISQMNILPYLLNFSLTCPMCSGIKHDTVCSALSNLIFPCAVVSVMESIVASGNAICWHFLGQFNTVSLKRVWSPERFPKR